MKLLSFFKKLILPDDTGKKRDSSKFYTTQIYLVDYINAYKNLKFSVDKTMIENHSAIDVYIKLESKSYKIPAGSTIKIKNDKYA